MGDEMKEIEGFDLSMLGDGSDTTRRDSIREIGVKIQDRVEQDRLNLGIKVILESEALLAEDKIDLDRAKSTNEQVIEAMGSESESYMKSFLQGLRKSRVVLSKIFGEDIDLARQLQKNPESIIDLRNFREAEKNGFTRILYIPGQVQNQEIFELVGSMTKEHGLTSWVEHMKNADFNNEKRPDHIYPIMISSEIDGPAGYFRGRLESADQALLELERRNEDLKAEDLELCGLTVQEYVFFQGYVNALKGQFRDISNKGKEHCLLLDSKLKKSAKTIGFVGGNIYPFDWGQRFQLERQRSFPKTFSCRFLLRKKDE